MLVETTGGYDDEDGELVRSESGGLVVRTERGDLALGEVDAITDVVRWRGAFEGLGLGIVIGGATGALLGYAGGESPHGFAKSAGENAVVSGILLGLLGGIVGLVVGTVRGSRDVYSGGPPPVEVPPIVHERESSA